MLVGEDSHEALQRGRRGGARLVVANGKTASGDQPQPWRSAVPRADDRTNDGRDRPYRLPRCHQPVVQSGRGTADEDDQAKGRVVGIARRFRERGEHCRFVVEVGGVHPPHR